VKAVSFVAALVLAWYVYHRVNAPITYPPGVLIAAEPVQVDAAPNLPAFDYGQFQLKPLARFALDGRVLHRKIYRYDRGAALVPVDLAVGWGRMSDQAVLDRLQISQAARFFIMNMKGSHRFRGKRSSPTRPTCISFPRPKLLPGSVDLCAPASWFIFRVCWWKQPAARAAPGAALSVAPTLATARANWSGWRSCPSFLVRQFTLGLRPRRFRLIVPDEH
jgi:hypothetical protein